MRTALLILLASAATLHADPRCFDPSSSNFQAAIQQAAQLAIQYQIDDAEWYYRQRERGRRPDSWEKPSERVSPAQALFDEKMRERARDE